jgi:hypothetical protein
MRDPEKGNRSREGKGVRRSISGKIRVLGGKARRVAEYQD